VLVSIFALGGSRLYAQAVLHQFWYLVEGFRLGNLFNADFLVRSAFWVLVSTFALGGSGLYAEAVLHQLWYLVEGFRLGNLFNVDFLVIFGLLSSI